jgi:DNA-binding NtrC family response regulator
MRAVLYVDDKVDELQALKCQLADRYRVITCSNGASAASVARREHPAAVVVDIEMPGYDGFRVLADLRALPDPPPVLMLSGYNEPLFVVRALREGAADFVSKPYYHTMVRRRLDALIEARSVKVHAASALVGSSPAMTAVRNEIASYATCDLPVFIVGESGTGKDLAAKELHRASARSAGPFEVRNIGAMPESLVESELFGCEAGAFTDARPRQGCFEEANGGTLFLDEIGDAGSGAQAALLRIVEDGMVRRLRGSRSRRIDCRLVCATNKDLDTLILERRFRDDLRYRLDVLSLKMPALRDRREDIPELVDHFLSSLSLGPAIADEALQMLLNFDWPGNVRQLKSCLDRARLLARGERIEPAHLRF